MKKRDGKKEFEKVVYKDRLASARIEASRDRLYRAADPVAISKIFFPQKDSFAKRTAFLAIIFELRKASYQRLEKLDLIPKKYDIQPPTFYKARQIMTRLGLIKKTSGAWHFSTRFEKAMERLIQNVETITAVPTQDEIDMEPAFIEAAKTEPVYYKLRKKDDEDKEEEPEGVDEFLAHNNEEPQPED